ncbi:MAG: hypothetical protein JNL42_04095 [Anaerolineae bacterium]|nr:hypothetical protein [Anaerolineae bacterium]
MGKVFSADLAQRLTRHLAWIARADLPPGTVDPLAAARFLSGGRPLRVLLPDPTFVVGAAAAAGAGAGHDEEVDPFGGAPSLDLLHGMVGEIETVEDPQDADLVLIVHLPGAQPALTAGAVELAAGAGHRVALVDLSRADGRADPALIPAINDTKVYFSNLVAFDVDLRRALAVALAPLRDGAAFRRYLVETALIVWAWRGIVEVEVRAAFGDGVPEQWTLRATTQARSRLGAHLLKVRGRGLRTFIDEVGFEGGTVDGFWFTLRSDS